MDEAEEFKNLAGIDDDLSYEALVIATSRAFGGADGIAEKIIAAFEDASPATREKLLKLAVQMTESHAKQQEKLGADLEPLDEETLKDYVEAGGISLRRTRKTKPDALSGPTGGDGRSELSPTRIDPAELPGIDSDSDHAAGI